MLLLPMMVNFKVMILSLVLFRYADVLLMKSEAKVRNGGNGDAELTEVRERAGATLDVTATLETLLEERLEFAWEGLRRQDLVRFGKFTHAYTDRPRCRRIWLSYCITRFMKMY